MFQRGQEDEMKHCMFTIWPCPSTRTPARGGGGGIRIDNFGKPFFGHDDYIISLRDVCLGVE